MTIKINPSDRRKLADRLESAPEPKESAPEPKESAPEPAPAPAPTAAANAGDIAAAIKAAIDAALAGVTAGTDEERVKQLIAEYATTETVTRHIVTVERPDLDADPVTIADAHPQLPKLLRHLQINMRSARYQKPWLVGPAGSGKTTLAVQAAEALSMAFYVTGAILEEHKLMGFVDANGKYHRTEFREAIEHGGLFLFDEIDGCLPAVLLTINMVLANGYAVFPDGERIEVDPAKTLFIAGANTIGSGATREYESRFAIDGATVNRFRYITVAYDAAVERAMAINAWRTMDGPAEQEETAIAWMQEVQSMRELTEQRRIQAMITPRQTETGAALLAAGEPWDSVREDLLLATLSEDQRRQLGV